MSVPYLSLAVFSVKWLTRKCVPAMVSPIFTSFFGLFRFARGRSAPLRGMRLQVGELRLEPDRALENAKRAHQQDCDTRDQNNALVIFLQPVHQCDLVLLLENRSPVIPSVVEESLTIFCSIRLRSLDFARDDKGAESVNCWIVDFLLLPLLPLVFVILFLLARRRIRIRLGLGLRGRVITV